MAYGDRGTLMEAAVHVGQLLQPVPGGIGRYVRQLLGALPAAGVDVHAFAAGPHPPGLHDVTNPSSGDTEVASYTDLGPPGGAVRYEAWHRFRRPVVRVPGDIVHATSLAVPPAGRRPLVVTVHDLVFLRQPEHLTSRGVAFHRRGLTIARREAAAIVVPTEFGRADLAQEGFDPERVHVAPHGVDPPPPDDPDRTAAVLDHLGVRPPFVLFVGTIEPRKGVSDLIAAHVRLRRKHPGLGLVLAGAAGWGEPPDVSGPGIVATGLVGDLEVDALYRAADALALPERYAGFGLPVIEAMARGCPVVVSDAACLPEVAGGAALVVPTGDVDALANALDEVLSDDARAQVLSDAGRARAATFTWAASAAAHTTAYQAARDRA